MRINTKAVFEWNSDTEQYEEIYSEGYDYEGEIDILQQYYPSKFGPGEGWDEKTMREKESANPWYLGRYLTDEDVDWRNLQTDKTRMGASRDMVTQWELDLGYDYPQGDKFSTPQKVVTHARRFLQEIEDREGGKKLISDIRDEIDYGYGSSGKTLNVDHEDLRKITGALMSQKQFPELWDISEELAKMMDSPPRDEKQDIRRTTDDRIFDLLPEDEGLFPEGDTKSKIPGE